MKANEDEAIPDMKLYAVDNILVMADTKENAILAYSQWLRDNGENYRL